jgi:hypothetical protein
MQHDKFHDVSRKPGFIYVLTNKTYYNTVKIGKTTRLPGYRAVELSKSSGVPKPFCIEYSRFVHRDLDAIEARIHEKLGEFRLTDDREFFLLQVEVAIKKVDEIINECLHCSHFGIDYRNIQHARWSYFLTRISVPHEYIIEPIDIGFGPCGSGFRPDFWLPDQNVYLIISRDFLNSDINKIATLHFAQLKKAVVIQFWECREGIAYGPDNEMIFHTGVFVTPGGDYDGGVEWGICRKCGSRHIGHFGFPELCDNADTNTSMTNCQCHTDNIHPVLELAYRQVRLDFQPV